MTEVLFKLDDGDLTGPSGSTRLTLTLAAVTVVGDTIHKPKSRSVTLRDTEPQSRDLVPGVWRVSGLDDTPILIDVPEAGPVDLKDLIVLGVPPSTPLSSLRAAVDAWLDENIELSIGDAAEQAADLIVAQVQGSVDAAASHATTASTAAGTATTAATTATTAADAAETARAAAVTAAGTAANRVINLGGAVNLRVLTQAAWDVLTPAEKAHADTLSVVV